MKKLLLTALSAALLTSCAASLTKTPPVRVKSSTPEIETVNSKEIGDAIFSRTDEEQYESLKIIHAPERPFIEKSYTLLEGDVLPMLAQNKEYDLFFHKSSVSESHSYDRYGVNETLTVYGLARNRKTGRVQPFIRQTTGYLGGVTVKPPKDLETEAIVYPSIECENCLKQEIVYNGKVGNSLKFMYREFVNDLARPAFTQDLQYDLAESNIIGFKGSRIEVIKATNTNITYKVLKSFE